MLEERIMIFFSKDNVKYFEVLGDDGKIDILVLLEVVCGVVEMVCKYFIIVLYGLLYMFIGILFI